MAESLGSAVLTVSVNDAQFQAGLNAARAKAEQASSTITQSFDGIAGGLRNLASLAGVVGIGVLTQQIIATGQASERSKIQLQALADAYGEAAGAGEAAARIQRVLGISALDARQSFAGLYAALRGTGIGLNQLEVLFVGISNAARLSGAGTQEASAALLQLKQGLASGVLQGDELRSVLEQLPAFAQAIAKELNVNVGALRRLGSEGKITSETVFNAAKQLATATTPGRTQIEQLTIAFTDVKEAAAEAFGPALGSVLRTTAAGIQAFGQYLKDNREGFIAVGRSVIELGQTLAPLIIGILAVRTAMNAWALASKGVAVAQAAVLALSGPKGWALLAIGIGAAAVATNALNKGLSGVGKATDKAKKEAQLALKEFQRLLSGSSLGGGSKTGATDQARIIREQNTLQLQGAQQQILYAKQLATLEGTALLQLQNKLAIEDKMRAAKAAQLAVERELAKPANQRDSSKIDDLLVKQQQANLEVTLAYEEAGASLLKNAKTAAEALRGAQESIRSTLRGGFDFLTPVLQQQQLEQARASVQPLVDRGIIRTGLDISTPDRLFQLAGFAESFASAEQNLVKAQQDNTAALRALTDKDTNVTVVVRSEGNTIWSEAVTQAIS